MGWDRLEIAITCTVSRHNSDRDDEHDALWDEFKFKVEGLMNDPKYREIQLGWK